MPKQKKERLDIYQRVTDAIVADLEKGVRPWTKPWSAENAAGRIEQPLRANGIPYKGINVLLLWGASVANGYSSPTWMTFKQALEHEAHVRKGEHGAMVVYADRIRKTETDAAGDEVEREIPFLKAYTVFNTDQIEGLSSRFNAVAQPRLDPVQRIEHAETIFKNTGAQIRSGGNRAYYSVNTDHIQMPPFEAFRDAESYAATQAHEMVHWTKHPARLDRDFGRKRWGDEGYATEEIVAELGAAFLCASLDLTPETREDHAQYVDSWLQVLKSDKRAVFTAASHAQRAADHLHSLQPA